MIRLAACTIGWRRDPRSYAGRDNLRVPFDELLPRLRGMGCHGVELWQPHVDHLDDAGLDDLRGLLAAHGMGVPMLSSYYNFTGSPAEAAKSLAHGHRVLAQAARLGASGIRIFTGKKRSVGADAGEWRRCCAALAELCDAAPQVAVAAEVHDWNLSDSLAGCERLVQQVDRPNFGFIFHPSLFPPDPLPAYRRLLPRIRHIHATNLDGRLADGRLDWRRIAGELRATGYAGWLAVEFFRADDPDAYAAGEAAFLAGAVAGA